LFHSKTFGSHASTFYAMNVINGVMLTFDYQYMMNTAHNADRGPISFFSGRLHGEF
jgi:high affinity Mn2+ porin